MILPELARRYSTRYRQLIRFIRLRTIWTLLAVAVVCVGAASCSWGPYIYKYEGNKTLDTRDEFDKIINYAELNGFHCADKRYFTQKQKKLFFKGTPVNLYDPLCKRYAAQLQDLLARVHKSGGNIESYLKVRGAECRQTEDTLHCVVIRDLKRLNYIGDIESLEIFTITIIFIKGTAPENVDIKREGSFYKVTNTNTQSQ